MRSNENVSGRRRKKGGPPSSPCRVERKKNKQIENSRFFSLSGVLARGHNLCVEAFKPSADNIPTAGDSNQVQLKKAGPGFLSFNQENQRNFWLLLLLLAHYTSFVMSHFHHRRFFYQKEKPALP